MTARLAAALSSLAVALVATACASYSEIAIETPIRSKLDVTGFQRVLVAGFIAGGTDDVDGNLETTRLLRSQLRNKTGLRVIDADVLPLAEVATEQNAPKTGEGGAPRTLPPIKEKKELEPYERLFANVEYWKKIGEEYQQPLIVTGTVMFTSYQQNGIVQQTEEVYDQRGRRSTVINRVFVERRGFRLEPKFVFIDGRTGTVMNSQAFNEAYLYAAQAQTPALSSYFELMDRILPSFLGVLSSQKIKGTRTLLL